MDPATELKILAHTQHVARHYFALRSGLDTIVTFIAYDMGSDAPPHDEIARFLRKESTQRLLEANWETSLWQATDKSWRLISLAPVTNVDQARRRLNHWPASKSTMCCWCYQDEKGRAGQELRPVLDIYRNPIPGRYAHKACQRPFLLMQAIVDRADSEGGES